MKWNKNEIEQLFYLIFLGCCIGGRLGYIIIYNFSYFSQNIPQIFYIWKGGMSFHGGLIGATVTIFYLSLKNKKNIFEISDFITPLIPFGLGAGRLGNFINCELWGRIAPNFPYAMLFPNSQNQDLQTIINHPQLTPLIKKYGVLPRHPSQLYEFFFEGVVLFLIMHIFTRKNRKLGNPTGLFLICYGIFRIIIEFFREPDQQIGLFKNIITMGQILSIPMIITGVFIILKSSYK
jgi:phosphatidylglycerol:prolipoprotein diacylglycerol transferase